MMARGAELLACTEPRVPDGLRHVPLARGERLRHRERHTVPAPTRRAATTQGSSPRSSRPMPVASPSRRH